MASEWIWVIVAIIIILIMIGILIYLAWTGASSTSIWLVAGALLIFIIIMALLVAFWPKTPHPPHVDHVIMTQPPVLPGPQSPATNVTFNAQNPNTPAPVTHNHFWGQPPLSSQTPPNPQWGGQIPNGTSSQDTVPLGPTTMDEDQRQTIAFQRGMTFRGQAPNGMPATWKTPDTLQVTKTNPGPVPVSAVATNIAWQQQGQVPSFSWQ